MDNIVESKDPCKSFGGKLAKRLTILSICVVLLGGTDCSPGDQYCSRCGSSLKSTEDSETTNETRR
ncbi:hypothetical protein [Pseudoflavonifractor capillosus]|uniref:Uncharacterized protein n=1 Tax=Pseudoflavonifractor capillosus TaxID=106588 RepID=A0A921MLN5_9FIRM|nr:hypothetical protein [Pseudoflavonifractor capillosus]HJG86371.1 hypothetical protein [Pseudoflavonifractor capillosus]